VGDISTYPGFKSQLPQRGDYVGNVQENLSFTCVEVGNPGILRKRANSKHKNLSPKLNNYEVEVTVCMSAPRYSLAVRRATANNEVGNA
jgi:hypothetical protein